MTKIVTAELQERLNGVKGLIAEGLRIEAITGVSPFGQTEYQQAVALVDLSGQAASLAAKTGNEQVEFESLELGKAWIEVIWELGNEDQHTQFEKHLLDSLLEAILTE